MAQWKIDLGDLENGGVDIEERTGAGERLAIIRSHDRIATGYAVLLQLYTR